MASSNLCVPVKLDAFVLNLDACDGTEDDKAKISPLVQPNYTYLHLKDARLDGMLRDDVITFADLYNAAPHQRNYRVTDIANGQTRTNRLGVYLHWMMPRPYRTGAASAQKDSAPSARARGIRAHSAPIEDDHTAPSFPLVPNRWLVIRKLRKKEPSDAPMKDIESWVVDSDLMRLVDELDDDVNIDLDMQTDVSPYLATTKDSASTGGPKINRQAEVFIGKKTPAEKWVETGSTTKRVALSLMGSSNELFPDYQPQNGNVFSILDTFEYDDGGKKKHLTSAEADYFVIGWNDNGEDDLMYLGNKGNDPAAKKMTRGERLAALNMSLYENIPDWSNSTEDSRILCSGSMYNVEWHETWTADTKPVIPADKVASDINKNEPLAVGTTPLDSLLAYVTADGSGQIEEGLKQLSALLRAQSESVEDRRAGADEVQSHNFSRHGGGSRYVLQIDPKNPAAPPSLDETKILSQLNNAQLMSDSIARQLQQTRWDLFSVWWQFQTNIKRDEHIQQYTEQTKVLTDLYQKLADMLAKQTTLVDNAKGELTNTMHLGLKEANYQEFYQHLDPTLFVGGVKAGWPSDFLKSLKTRLDPQIQGPTSSAPASSDYTKCIPSNLRTTADLLFREFLWYENPGEAISLAPIETKNDTFPPLYHDGRDLWKKTQPWFPLYLEWEAEYCHIPFPDWEVDEVATDKKDFKKFRYVVEQKDKPLWDMKIDDRRIVSGRILLLPQPVFSLHADIERLFERVPAETIKKLIGMDPEKFKAAILDLPFISAPLNGFISHLLTLKAGTHLKPNVRYPGKAPEPLPESYADSVNIGIGEPQVKLMGTETNFTPYGSLARLTNEKYPAFKPATHGQFKFTKLNIVDKFGQTACVVNPARRGIDPDVTPYIGEYYRPQPYKDGSQGPNVVDKPTSPDDCRFMQMPPSINQLSRWNFEFVTLEQPKKPSEPYWRPVSAWENPVWGWVVVNYVDYGVQFFLSDGTFYREIRIADVNNPGGGTIEANAWLPFQAPKNLPQTSQLNKLIGQFVQEGGQKYLMSFIKMLNGAAKDTTTAPGAYSQCVNSLIGKPFALVNAGASLELATAANTNQSTAGGQQQLRLPYELLRKGSEGQYEFPIKLGDHAKPHDGLVGYFQALAKPEDGLDVTKTYTSFADPTDHILPIDKTTFPKIKPFRLDPTKYNTGAPEQQASDYVLDKSKELTTFGLIVDPFTSVHIYSSILPIQPLKLAQWTWETAIKNMTAFFHIGPIVLPDDVPKYDPKMQLGPSYDLTKDTQLVKDSKIELPSLPKAQWGWLQPYMTEGPPPPSASTGGGEKQADPAEPNFMALNLGKWDPRPKFEKGPFTAIEGYLQMKKPMFTEDPTKG